MSNQHHGGERRVKPSGSTLPGWRLVFSRELSELWIGGRALNLLILFSIVLGITSFLLATNSELSLIPPKEMVFLILEASIAFGLFIGLIIAADSISGERERATLEGLLLTPTSRRQIVVGKFLADVSPWPAALVVSFPYVAVLAQGDEVLSQALLWGVLMGSILALAFTGLGMLVSIWSNSNKTSLFVSLVIYLLFLIPTQLPGEAQTGAVGDFVQVANPMEASHQFLEKVLVNNRTLEEIAFYLLAPILLAALVLGVLFLYAGPRLQLEGGKAGRFRSYWGRVVGLVVTAGLMVSLGTPRAMALQGETSTGPEQPLQITIDMNYKVVKAGDPILFNTVVTNYAREESPPLTVAMNIINLEAQGDVVDPEDWSPERTQYVEHLAPGQSTKHSWRVNAILDGDYLVYMVVIPKPGGEQATSQPVTSSGIHLTVTPFTRLNPAAVLPYSVGGPSVLLLGAFFLYRLRRRRIEMGGNS